MGTASAFARPGTKGMFYAELTVRQKVLAVEIRALMEEAKTVDADENARFGPGTRGEDGDDITGAGYKAAQAAEPKPTAQRNFTEPDARIVKPLMIFTITLTAARPLWTPPDVECGCRVLLSGQLGAREDH